MCTMTMTGIVHIGTMAEDAGGPRHQFRVIGSVISCLGERRGYVDSPFITMVPLFSLAVFFFSLFPQRFYCKRYARALHTGK